jgi:8-oxo-dGTP pyrophosphatase MutT (NUDIX family)
LFRNELVNLIINHLNFKNMAQVYAIMHNGKGEFMIAFKNTRGYFFHNPAGGGTIIPAGQILNGGHNWAFPGGRLEVADPVQGALHEFLEETGVGLDAKMAAPNVYAARGYYGVYFNAGSNFIPLLKSAQMNLDLGRQAAAKVIDGTYGIGQYAQLMTAYQGCPADNELSDVYPWNLREQIAEINMLGRDPSTNWYFNILANLALQTYGVIVTDADGLLAGIGETVVVEAGPIYQVSVFTEDPNRLLPQGYYTIVTNAQQYRHLNFTSLAGGIASFRG